MMEEAMMEEATAASPPPPKKRRVAAAVQQEEGEAAAWTGSPLLLLATVASEVAEEEERERKAAEEGRAVHYSKIAVGLPPPAASNEQQNFVGIPLKKRTAAPVLPHNRTSTVPDCCIASATRPAPHATTDDALEAEKEKNNRPCKRLKTGEKSARMGWVEKSVCMGACSPCLITEKQLTNTDLSAHHSRLLLGSYDPEKPWKTSGSGVNSLVGDLRENEYADVFGEAGLPVTLLDRSGWEYHGAILRHWRSKKWIIINGAWLRAAHGSELEAGDCVEVFRFRSTDGGLVLVLSGAEAR